MEKLNSNETTRKEEKQPGQNINIAGDFSSSEYDQFDESGNSDRIAIQPNARAENSKATRDSLKSATGPSTLGQESGKKLVNPATDWAVYD